LFAFNLIGQTLKEEVFIFRLLWARDVARSRMGGLHF